MNSLRRRTGSKPFAEEELRTEAAGEAEMVDVVLLQSAASLRKPDAGSKKEIAIDPALFREVPNNVKHNSTSLIAAAASEYCAHDVAYDGGALSDWGGDDVSDAAACQGACAKYPLFTYWPNSGGCRCSQEGSSSSQTTWSATSGSITCLVDDNYVNVLATNAVYQRKNAVGDAYLISDIPDDWSAVCFTVHQTDKSILFGATTDAKDDESFPNGVVAHLTNTGEFVPPSGGASGGYNYVNGHYNTNDRLCWRLNVNTNMVFMYLIRTDEVTGKTSGLYGKAWTLSSSAAKAKIFLVDDGAAGELS